MIEIKAPGRICLFGDHQDYLGLPVIACSINRYVNIRAIKNYNNIFRIKMPDINQERIIDLESSIASVSSRDYFVSALNVLQEVACIPDKGYDIVITGDIPINAGLSSSSAIVVAWIAFLLEAFGSNTPVSSELIAKLAYKSEVIYYNSPGGLMDQYTISIGGLLFLNTINGAHKHINKGLQSLIIGESGVPKQTLGVLSKLRGFALEAIRSVQLQVPDFKIEKTTMDDYELYGKLVSKEIRPIFYAAIKNYQITKEAFEILNSNHRDLHQIGKLMTDHHLVLKDTLKITVPIIDEMISGAIYNGALGAKIVGSGGGGSIVALTDQENEKQVIKGMLDAGAANAYKVHIVDGVEVLKREYE